MRASILLSKGSTWQEKEEVRKERICHKKRREENSVFNSTMKRKINNKRG